MIQRMQDGVGEAIGRFWLTIFGGLIVLAIAGGFAFAWNSNNQITTLTANSANTQQDVRDIKADLRDMRLQMGLKPAPQPTQAPGP